MKILLMVVFNFHSLEAQRNIRIITQQWSETFLHMKLDKTLILKFIKSS